MRRFFLIVLDGCGAGELPDAHEYSHGDPGSNTLGNTSRAVGGLQMPNLESLGWGNITPMQGVAPRPGAHAAWGRLTETSKGKDTVTGHWEMMGIQLDVPFPTYPNGFPPDIIAAFEAHIGTRTLGNKPASGTEILKELGEEHLRTGYPIVYTSADSVFQVAAHEDPAVFGLERLYEACSWARGFLATPPHHMGRVIARPFVGDSAATFQRTEHRRDYPLAPPHTTAIDRLCNAGVRVHLIGKTCELFPLRDGITREPTTNNPDHMAALGHALRNEGSGSDAQFIFANLEDFDMLYGHRNDPQGFARLLEAFDDWVGAELLPLLRPDDLIGITADHGNDPTTPSTDHSREYAPLLLFGPPQTASRPLGDRATFADWSATIGDWLGVEMPWGEGFSPLPRQNRID